MRLRGGTLALVTLLLATTLVPAAPVATADGCASGAPPAWFLAVAYDAARASWSLLDLDHFHAYLATLRGAYCIPEANAAFLAFDNNFQRNGRTYEAATEAAVKAHLAEFGAQSRGVEDAHLFFFLTSHGLMWPNDCPGGTRLGSFAALRSGGGEDGDLSDCELGSALNAHFDPATRMWIMVDCSFCGGFSESLTAASGTANDNGAPVRNGIVRANRVVVTGCAITTECFGNNQLGSTTFRHLRAVMDGPISLCDGWTTPGFPAFYGVNAPARIGPQDGRCTASEWFFGAVQSAYGSADAIGIQQQFRMKWGLGALENDLAIK